MDINFWNHNANALNSQAILVTDMDKKNILKTESDFIDKN